MQGNFFTGISYVFRGAALLLKPGFRKFLFIPLLINILVFSVATYYLMHIFGDWMDWALNWLPDWQWLRWLTGLITTLLWGSFASLLLIIYGYSFSTFTNLIAAPFYGLLAEKVQEHVTGNKLPPESFGHIIARTLARELVKLWYFVSRGIAIFFILFLMSFIPLINIAVPFLALIWGAWAMSLQYCDYPADNNKLPFSYLRDQLHSQLFSSMGLGGLVMAGLVVPVLNIFVMPAAVAGGTLFWLEDLRFKGQFVFDPEHLQTPKNVSHESKPAEINGPDN